MVAHPSLSNISADDVSNVAFKIILAALFWSFNMRSKLLFDVAPHVQEP